MDQCTGDAGGLNLIGPRDITGGAGSIFQPHALNLGRRCPRAEGTGPGPRGRGGRAERCSDRIGARRKHGVVRETIAGDFLNTGNAPEHIAARGPTSEYRG